MSSVLYPYTKTFGAGVYYERKFKKQGCNLIIGVDEAGRGPLAGPVVAAAVKLNTYSFKNRIDDSKKLTPKLREAAFQEIVHKGIFGIGIVEEKVIDSINILEATRRAMKEAIISLIDKLRIKRYTAIHIIVDGNMSLDINFAYSSIVNGDAKSKTIACASIIAKVIRDRIMSLYDRIYPEYGFFRHKGYPTDMHRERLKNFGPSRIHRVSFSCLGNGYI